jgi:hypothetical protein
MLIRKRIMMIGLPLLIGGVGGVAPMFAQAAGTDSDAPATASAPSQSAEHTERRHFDPVARTQKHLDKLKAALRITPEQELQWSAFADKILTQVQQVRAEHESVKVLPATAPERIDRQLMLMKERASRFEVVAQAAKDLYSILTPEQKQIADKKLLSFHHKHRA